MLVNKQSIKAIFSNIKTVFNNAFKGADSQWEKIAMRVPSSGSENDYSWMANFPKMREWLGAKVVKRLAAFNYTIRNRAFESTVGIHKHDIADDNIGIVRPQAEMAGFSAKQWPDELVFELVAKSFTQECYDGQYFCDTDHPVGDGVVSNKGTDRLDISTQAAAKATFGAARTAMRSFKDDEGRPLGVKPDVILVGPALEDLADTLYTSDRLEDGKPNIYKGKCKPVVADWIEGEEWFLLDTSKPIKPFIFQERQAPEMVSQTDLDSDKVFSTGEFQFGAEARGNAGYGLWQLAYGSTGTTDHA